MMKLDSKKKKLTLQERLKILKRNRRNYIENALLPLISDEEGAGLPVSDRGEAWRHAGTRAVPGAGHQALMREFRFLQSQMSANAPTSPKPTSQDSSDPRRCLCSMGASIS